MINKLRACTLGGACGAGLLGLLCPFCIPAIATLLISLGFGSFLRADVLLTIFALFSLLLLMGLIAGYRSHHSPFPLLIGVPGLAAIAVGAYVLFQPIITNSGVAAVVTAGVLNVLLPRKAMAASVPLLVLTTIVGLTLLGFMGYRFGFLRFIENVMMPGNFGQFSLPVLSALFGTAAFFSPCALTVLPTYISHYLGGGERPTKYGFLELLMLGLLGALGIILVNMLIGLAIALLGATAPFAKDPREDIAPILAIRTIAGLFIAYMGYRTLTRKGLHIPLIDQLIEGGTLRRSIFGYGILYNAAAIGCTGPILLGLMLFAFQTGSFSAAFSGFTVFSLTMGFWMALLTILTGLFKQPLVRQMIAPAPALQRITGIVMIVAGLTIAILTLEGNRIFVKLFFPFLP